MIIVLVREGEKLSDIASRYGTTTDAIVKCNRHRPSVQLASGERVFASLSAGDEILMPASAGMANPASVYCGELGGKLSVGATQGDCSLPDGTVCDEWALFRGQCPGYPAKYPELANVTALPAMPVSQPEPAISKPMIAGGLAVLGVAIATATVVFLWPKK